MAKSETIPLLRLHLPPFRLLLRESAGQLGHPGREGARAVWALFPQPYLHIWARVSHIRALLLHIAAPSPKTILEWRSGRGRAAGGATGANAWNNAAGVAGQKAEHQDVFLWPLSPHCSALSVYKGAPMALPQVPLFLRNQSGPQKLGRSDKETPRGASRYGPLSAGCPKNIMKTPCLGP